MVVQINSTMATLPLELPRKLADPLVLLAAVSPVMLTVVAPGPVFMFTAITRTILPGTGLVMVMVKLAWLLSKITSPDDVLKFRV